MGYNGDGVEYCDECGISSIAPNSRVVGGVTALDYSWPSAALIIASYKTDMFVNGQWVKVEVSFMCGGTLINRRTVMSAAHCVDRSSFEYDHHGNSYTIKIKANDYFPTHESMYKVFLGVQNRTVLLNADIAPARKLEVESVKTVTDGLFYRQSNIKSSQFNSISFVDK